MGELQFTHIIEVSNSLLHLKNERSENKTVCSFPVNICWFPRRHLQHVFSVTIFRLPGHLEDISLDVFKVSWKTKNFYAEDVLKKYWKHVLKTSWRHVLKTPSRGLGDKQNVYWGYLYLTNLNVYLTNLCFTNLYLTNLRLI